MRIKLNVHNIVPCMYIQRNPHVSGQRAGGQHYPLAETYNGIKWAHVNIDLNKTFEILTKFILRNSGVGKIDKYIPIEINENQFVLNCSLYRVDAKHPTTDLLLRREKVITYADA